MMKILLIFLSALGVAVGGYLLWSQYGFEAIKEEVKSEETIMTENPTEEEPARSEETESSAHVHSDNLEDHKWVWLYTELSTGERVTAPAGELFVLSFDENGKVSSLTDCNSLGGTFTKDGEVLSFGNFTSTKMYCEGSVEDVYVEQLVLVNSFVIEGHTLRFNLNRDYGVMVFEGK